MNIFGVSDYIKNHNQALKDIKYLLGNIPFTNDNIDKIKNRYLGQKRNRGLFDCIKKGN